MSTLRQFYFETGTLVEAPHTVDWDTVLKRQRAIQGICGKTQPDFSEQWIQQMSRSTEEKVRALQKTGASRSQKIVVNDWLDSPNTTAEARLRRLDSGHLKTPNTQPQPKEWVQWKAASQPVALFEESSKNPEAHSAFLCQIPNVQPEIRSPEKFHQFLVTPVSACWPSACEKMRRSAPAQVRQLADHLESLKNSGRTLLNFCSNKPGCGCTTIVLLCAREISSRGWKTLLIDGNFSHPSLAEAFQLSPSGGWESLLEKGTKTTTLWALEDNLDLLPLDAAFAERANILFQDVCFSDWAETFRNDYDLVLIDSGPLSERGKHAQLKRFFTDGVFLIVDDPESFHRIRQSLTQHEIVFLGFVENHAR